MPGSDVDIGIGVARWLARQEQAGEPPVVSACLDCKETLALLRAAEEDAGTVERIESWLSRAPTAGVARLLVVGSDGARGRLVVVEPAVFHGAPCARDVSPGSLRQGRRTGLPASRPS